MKRKNVDETQNRQLKIAPSKNDILSICNTNETKLLCKFDAVIVYVSHYAHFTLLVTKDGRLFGVGDSRIKNIPKASLPTLIETPGHVASASFGNKRIIAIMQDGTLMGMGDNTSNALGFTSDYVETMTALPSKNHNYERVEFVTCVYSSSIAITSQSLFVFGQISWYMPERDLKICDSTRFDIDHIVEGHKKVFDLRSGTFHVVILNNAGEIFTGGSTDCFETTGNEYYGFKKLVTSYICSSIECSERAVFMGTREGELVLYNFKHYTGKVLNKIQEEISSITHYRYAQTAFLSIRGDIFLRQDNKFSQVKADNAVSYAVGRTEEHLILVPIEKRFVCDHFVLMKQVRNELKLCDVEIKQ